MSAASAVAFAERFDDAVNALENIAAALERIADTLDDVTADSGGARVNVRV